MPVMAMIVFVIVNMLGVRMKMQAVDVRRGLMG
jgi:hypothetical protein